MRETIRIGNFRLTKMPTGNIYIEICGDGEGGEFQEVHVEAVIAEFYAKNF